MPKIFKTFISAIIAFLMALTDTYAKVPGPGGGELPTSEAEQFGGFSYKDLVGDIITRILPVVLTLGGFITVIVIIISGIQFVTSGGNPEAAAAAKNRLVYALIGFIIIILAFAILQIVDKLFLGTSGVV